MRDSFDRGVMRSAWRLHTALARLHGRLDKSAVGALLSFPVYWAACGVYAVGRAAFRRLEQR